MSQHCWLLLLISIQDDSNISSFDEDDVSIQVIPASGKLLTEDTSVNMVVLPWDRRHMCEILCESIPDFNGISCYFSPPFVQCFGDPQIEEFQPLARELLLTYV